MKQTPGITYEEYVSPPNRNPNSTTTQTGMYSSPDLGLESGLKSIFAGLGLGKMCNQVHFQFSLSTFALVFRLDALALSVSYSDVAGWLGGWLGGCLSQPVLYQND